MSIQNKKQAFAPYYPKTFVTQNSGVLSSEESDKGLRYYIGSLSDWKTTGILINYNKEMHRLTEWMLIDCTSEEKEILLQYHLDDPMSSAVIHHRK